MQTATASGEDQNSTLQGSKPKEISTKSGFSGLYSEDTNGQNKGRVKAHDNKRNKQKIQKQCTGKVPVDENPQDAHQH